ncbi:putative UDP-3-O-acyl-N-acetylglucosamine deacetylase 2 isoform X2 [Iris pallida]|uniref:UDP-3-O-acyl-N-acetylglucosamine deacetylase n=1 Tax=Iris pallida TaxID=29817 RepID=A0AAX6I7K7_IRIPA|nr:putative UDP-3-O-acyl-N-acetylglucosamine deacetylase 2 isoform X2 [Iris pallida]
MRHHPRFFCTRALHSLFQSLSWKLVGKPQQTLASPASHSGVGLHSGDRVTARLLPVAAGEGRYFVVGGARIGAAIENVVDSALCTVLARHGRRVRTVEHLLSALEGLGVDNCRIEIDGGDEVPILDGSAKEWVEAIQQVGICVARDSSGGSMDKLAPFLRDPKYVWRDDSFIVAIPSSKIHIKYGINFPQAPSIGQQWFSSFIDGSTYSKEIAPSRTFCIYEEVEKMRKAGLVKGGSMENAMVCSTTAGWLNPPLRFDDEPCRHKVVDLVGDFSLLAQNGNQGFPVADIIAYKAGHTLHAEFVRLLSGMVR